MNALSRRDFLKLGGYSLLGLFLPNLPFSAPMQDSFIETQGRVTDRILWTYDSPDFKAKRVRLHWRDLILSIKGVEIGDDESAHNRVWYEIEGEGYAYSGGIQPVRTILNESKNIPLAGALGEVSVPYTEAREAADPASKTVYRLYYETVHWITGSEVSSVDGSVWYLLLDDKWKKYYHAPAKHIRIIPSSELAPLSQHIPSEDKRIEVRLDDQLLLAYEKERPVFVARVSTGAVLRSGTYTTPTGNFITYHKRPTRHMAAGDIASSGFDLPGVPWVLYITESGISFHGTYWHNDYGRPRSHGCINLTPQAARWLFRWSMPTVPLDKEYVYGFTGTKVEIKI